MKQSFFLACLYIFLLTGVLFGEKLAKEDIECRVIVSKVDSCNPYSFRFVKAKEKIDYDKSRQRLIVEKTLPVPQRPHLKIISVDEMVQRYVKVESSMRFKGTGIHIPVQKRSAQKGIVSVPAKQAIQTVESKKYPTEAITIKKGIYNVQRGDTLSRIAHLFHTTTEKLQTINAMGDKDRLKIGQKIVIPVSQETIDAVLCGSYTVKQGDTLLGIAKRFSIDPKILAKENNIVNSADLYKGRVMILPSVHIKRSKVARKKLLKKATQKSRFIHAEGRHKLRVTATAYTSHRGQTDATPFLAAWNNRLRPGMKAIAVSRDLIWKYGLKNGTKVRISGLPGIYRVRDKMNKRYKRRIDIYMGTNRRKALKWGRRSVVIYW